MRRLIALLSLSVCAWATTTVTGNIKSLGTSSITSGAFVRFWLRGCGGNQPRITGTGLIGPTQGGVFYFDFPADGSGNVSGTLYSTRDAAGTGNGEIECGGSYTAVWYGMQAFVAGKGGPEVPVHAKSGTTLDITAVTPITTNPVVTSPTGDTTYLRLDAGNSPITGALTHSGATATIGLFNDGAHTTTLKNNCTNSVGATGFLCVNSGISVSSSFESTGGSLALLANDAYIKMFNNGFDYNIQAGPRTEALLATRTVTLPEIGEGSGSGASGNLLGVSGAVNASAPGNCLFYSSNVHQGSMKDSGFGCNTHLGFPTRTQRVQWTDGANNGQLSMDALTASRTWQMPDIDGKVVIRIASGTATLGTGAISSNACAAAVTVGATGVATTDAIAWSFNADPNGVTGYGAGSTGTLSIWAYPTANNVNFRVCNLTSGSITPGAATLNWRVVR